MSIDLEEEYDKIFRYCYTKLSHRQLAEDVTQETFLRYLENHTYREMGKQTAYLYTIARNLCVDHYRSRKELPQKEEAVRGHEDKVIEDLTLFQAVRQLEEKDQELVCLRYVNELSVSEVGRILGMSRFAVYRRTRKVLERLREILGEGDAD